MKKMSRKPGGTRLPEGVEIKIGSAPGPEGWAADWDGFISSVHATLLEDGKLPCAAAGNHGHHEPYLLQSRRKRTTSRWGRMIVS